MQTPYTNIGYWLHEFSREELEPVWAEINSLYTIQPTDNHLINHKCELTVCKQHVEQLVIDQIIKFNHENNWPNQLRVLDRPCNLKLTQLWVNWMSKHEFSAIHSHQGVMSFVIWLTIPYTRASEQAAREYVPPMVNFGGQFAIHYTNTMGQITTENLASYNDWENVMCLMPAGMNHSVNPFYSSDEIRISIAGNFFFDPGA